MLAKELPSKEESQKYNGIFSDYETISISQEPIKFKWALYPMYKESQTEGILYWRVGFDGYTDELVTEHGYDITSTGKKGKLQVDRLKLYTNNLHKTILSKALQDTTKAYQDKYKEGYSDENGIVIDLPAAQTGNRYPIGKQSDKDPLKSYNFKRGIALQAKLDGIRARIWNIKGEIKIYTRENNLHPWLDTYIKPEAKIFLSYLPSGVGIDCELYNPAFLFTELTSIVKTYKTKHPKNDLVYCYIFDIILLNTSLDKRMTILKNAYLNSSQNYNYERIRVLDHTILYDKSLLKKYHDEFVKLGYEGMMIRKLIGKSSTMNNEELENLKLIITNEMLSKGYNGKTLDSMVSKRIKEEGLSLTQKEIDETWYKPGKNNNLLKVKDFIDEEGVILNIIGGEGREAELAIMVIEDIRGNKFSVRPRGNFEDRRLWLINKNLYIGKKYTIRYFELSEYGVPRFPVGVAFRDYE